MSFLWSWTQDPAVTSLRQFDGVRAHQIYVLYRVFFFSCLQQVWTFPHDLPRERMYIASAWNALFSFLHDKLVEGRGGTSRKVSTLRCVCLFVINVCALFLHIGLAYQIKVCIPLHHERDVMMQFDTNLSGKWKSIHEKRSYKMCKRSVHVSPMVASMGHIFVHNRSIVKSLTASSFYVP